MALSFTGAILLILLSLWSLYAGNTDKRVLLLAFIMFLGSMWITGIAGLFSGKKVKLQVFDVVMILLYLLVFFFVGQTNSSLLSSALSISLYYITATFYNALESQTPPKHAPLFKIILWLWFLLMGVVFKGFVAV